MPTTHHPLGIDIGGSGIKGAPVDLAKGQFAKDRQRFENTKLSSPDAVVDIVVQIAEHFADDTGTPHRRHAAGGGNRRGGAYGSQHRLCLDRHDGENC